MTERRTRERVALLFVVGCAPAAPTFAPVPDPTPADIVEAMRSPAWGWYEFPPDGTARRDTARSLGALGLWDLEGGDRDRGLRLTLAAHDAGLEDIPFLEEAAIGMLDVARPDLSLRFTDRIIARCPERRTPWSLRADALDRLGRAGDAVRARARADSLPVPKSPTC